MNNCEFIPDNIKSCPIDKCIGQIYELNLGHVGHIGQIFGHLGHLGQMFGHLRQM